MWDKYTGILLYLTEIFNGMNRCNMVLKNLVKECRVLIFKHDGSGHKHNENSNDSGGGGGSIQCSLCHMDVLWGHKIISVCQLQ